MVCDVCERTNGHLSGCPNNPHTATGCPTCKLCEEAIMSGDKYIEIDGEFWHNDCLYDLYYSELLDEIGIEVKEM